MYEYTANAYLYIDYSISGPVQVVQNMPDVVTKSGLQKYKWNSLYPPLKPGPKNNWEIKRLQKTRRTENKWNKTRRKCVLWHVGVGRQKRRQEEQLRQSQDVQGTAPLPGAEPKADSLIFLTVSLRIAAKVGRETRLYI